MQLQNNVDQNSAYRPELNLLPDAKKPFHILRGSTEISLGILLILVQLLPWMRDHPSSPLSQWYAGIFIVL